MDHSNQDRHEQRVISRRGVIKGGLATAAGAAATFMAVRSGTAALTPLDVKSPGFTTNAVQPVSTLTEKSGKKGK